MKTGRNVIGYIICIVLGLTLVFLGYTEMIDSYWSGMGSGVIAVSVVQLVRLHRFRKDKVYREKVETEVSDERNRFIRNKAWAWAGYLFILIAGISCIVLKVMGQDLLSLAASYAVCLILLLYYGAYLVLRNKY